MIRAMSSEEFRLQEANAMLEKVLQEKVRRMCEELGWLHYHTHNSQHSASGFPDSFMINKTTHRILVRELKRQREKPSAKQLVWLTAMDAAGLDVGVWRPMDLFNGTIVRELTLTA